MEIKDLNLGNDVSSVLKRDGALLGTAGLLKSYLTKHAKTAALGNKISVKGIAKGLGFIELANAASATVQDLLPHVSEALDWSMALPFNILNQTLGRIPGIGAIFRWIHNALTNVVTNVADALGFDGLAVTGSKLVLRDPNEGFETETNFKDPGKKFTKEEKELKNDPKFYESLDLHKEFSIPGAYTKKTVVNGTLATPTIVVHKVTENPVADAAAMRDRLNQKFTLIKAVRGLSATQYSLIDVANYERFAKMCLFQYFTVKKVVQAAKTYALIQTQIGDSIIDSLGFTPSEVRTNLAQYETLLCQMHRFITNNIPVSGTWVKRLEYIIGANIPDYNNQAVATIHMFALSMRSVFTKNVAGEDNYGEKVFDCIPSAANNSYTVLMNNFLDLQQVIVNNTIWQQLIADYFGAFGSKAMWEDKDYPSYAKPLNLRNADNDLSREQVKNALYAGGKIEFITIDEKVANKKFNLDLDSLMPVQLDSYIFGNSSFNGQNRVPLTYNNLLDQDAYLQAQSYSTITMGGTNKVLLPDMNGCGAREIALTDSVAYYDDMENHETIYTLHKDRYSEGEALEISQFKSRCIGRIFYIETAQNTCSASAIFKTHEYAIQFSVVYTFGSTGSSIALQTYTITNEVISDDDLQDVESPVDYPDEIMCWCLVDWMPMTHFTFFGYNSKDTKYYPRDIAAIDMDSFGSLDDRAYSTSINYSIYSLQAANLAVDAQHKRISNLGDVYKDKPSRKG